MSWLHPLKVKKDGFVDTGGVNYGPWNSMTMLWQGERLAVVHLKGNYQYWSQNKHYIRASVMIFEKKDVNEYGEWMVEKIEEKHTGRASRRIKAELIEWAKENDQPAQPDSLQ